MTHIIDGKAIAERLTNQLGEKAVWLKENYGKAPCLAAVLVEGLDPASAKYVSMKEKKAASIGFEGRVVTLPINVTEVQLLAKIEELNNDETLHGFIVQLPIPKEISKEAVIQAVSPLKDIDGFHTQNVGALVTQTEGTYSCTPWGCMTLIEEAMLALDGEVNYRNKTALVIGRSDITGTPAANFLIKRAGTTMVATSGTSEPQLKDMLSKADIVVACAGQPEMVKGEWVKEGAIIIDVGTTFVDGKLKGDVAFKSASDRAGAISPVPGGVGPMTIAKLLENTLIAAERQLGVPESDRWQGYIPKTQKNA